MIHDTVPPLLHFPKYWAGIRTYILGTYLPTCAIFSDKKLQPNEHQTPPTQHHITTSIRILTPLPPYQHSTNLLLRPDAEGPWSPANLEPAQHNFSFSPSYHSFLARQESAKEERGICKARNPVKIPCTSAALHLQHVRTHAAWDGLKKPEVLRSRRKMMHPRIVTATSINQQHLQGMALRAHLGLVPLKVFLDGLHSRSTNHHRLACGHGGQRGVSGDGRRPEGVCWPSRSLRRRSKLPCRSACFLPIANCQFDGSSAGSANPKGPLAMERGLGREVRTTTEYLCTKAIIILGYEALENWEPRVATRWGEALSNH